MTVRIQYTSVFSVNSVAKNKMDSTVKKSAFSLVELLVALGIIAALAVFAIPAIKTMQKSFDSTGAESMISAALGAARTLAISRQKYTGVRFQKAYNGDNILDADQYMIFIENDNDIRKNMDYIFRAIQGYKPIKLPANTGVMDLMLFNAEITSDNEINENWELTDTTTFSVVFSPSGKISMHNVEVRNDKGGDDNDTDSNDQVFNTLPKITHSTNPAGMFLQDYNPRKDGLGREQSRRKFYIYDCEKFKKIDSQKRYTEYLKNIKLKPVSINPYTGEIIKN